MFYSVDIISLLFLLFFRFTLFEGFLVREVLIEGPIIHLLHVLTVGDAQLFVTVWIVGLIAEDSLDLVVEVLSTVLHEQNLEGLLDGDASLESLIVHEESN